MSVMTLDLKVYKEVYKKACSYRWHSTVDIDYCNSLQSNEGYLRQWVYRLYEMVHVSYCVHYHEGINKELLQLAYKQIETWRFDNLKGPNCSTYQMLKWLRCIRYQIEDYEMKPDGMWKGEYDEVYELLNNAIAELKDRIIAEIPEYNEAKWGEV